MITCTRCGKENQDHYKFCLGCGAELKRAEPSGDGAPDPRASLAPSLGDLGGQLEESPSAPARDPLPLEVARTMLPPDPGATPAPDLGSAALAAQTARKKGGIPWNDSPKPPPSFGPGFGPATPPPIATGYPGHGVSATAQSPAPAFASGAVGGPVPSQGSGPVGGIPCPNCGKSVTPGYAFCGSCGMRMSPSGSAAPAGSPQRAAAPVPLAPVLPRGRLVLIRPDGTEGLTHPLQDGATMIGRGQATLFDQDAYLSPRHAEFALGPDGLTIRDLHSLNGVFVKIAGEEEIQSADVFRIGQELLRFDVITPPSPLEDGTEVAGTPNPGFWGRLSVVVGRDVDGSAFPLFGDAVVLGRERGDILFPEDGYVSGTHARIGLRDGRVFLADLGSSNGSFLKIRGERRVASGSFVLMGQQLFRIEYR